MTAPRDPDSILAAWLDEGPNRLPSSTRRAILTSTHVTKQERHLKWVPRRISMQVLTRVAVAAIVVVAIVGGRYGLDGLIAGPGASQASPTPNSALDTSTWTTYTSDRYGFSIGHPADWTERPADHTWVLANDHDWLSTASEGFKAPGDAILATAWSVAVEPGTTAEAWLAAYCPLVNDPPCPPSADPTVAVTIDGHPGSLVQFPQDTEAFVLVGDRMYVVAVWQPESDASVAPYGGATKLLQGFLSTVHLLPGGPAHPSPSLSPAPSDAVPTSAPS